MAWGETLLHGDRLGYELTGTTPKPLAGILGLLAARLPPERAMGVLVALALGVLVAALFVAAERRAGVAAGVVALVVFLAAANLANVLAYQLVDAVTAALVAVALAGGGRPRIAALIVAGLLRPEAWALAGVAAFLEAKHRRVVAAVLAAVAAPAIWLGYDAIVTGDPLATVHRTDDLLAPAKPWGAVLESLADRISPLGFALVGLAGLGFALRRNADVALPAATMVVWPLVLVVEAQRGLPIAPRYLLPPLVAVSLGMALLVPRLAPRWIAAAGGIAAVLAFVLTLDFGADRWAQRVLEIRATAPIVEPVLECGTVGVADVDRKAGADIGALAAATGHSLLEFASSAAASTGGVVRVRADDFTPPTGWSQRSTPLGPLFVSPACRSS